MTSEHDQVAAMFKDFFHLICSGIGLAVKSDPNFTTAVTDDSFDIREVDTAAV